MPIAVCICRQKKLSDDNERAVLHHILARLHENSSDSASVLCLKVVSHLHGFENDNRLSFLNLVSHSDAHFFDDTGER